METYQWRRSQGRVFPGREKATSPRLGRAWHGEETDEVSPCWALVGEKERSEVCSWRDRRGVRPHWEPYKW